MKKHLTLALALALTMVLALSACDLSSDIFGPILVPPTEPDSYEVYFHAGDGVNISAQTVHENELVIKPKDPTKNGYRFDGWYKDSECTVPWDFEHDFVTQNTILYGKWVHECESICPDCGKCLDAECKDEACADKCQGHHECESICPDCGKCLDAECKDEACADKCQGHHVCESICPDCGKCLDAECKDEACADKCQGHHECESICPDCGKCLDAECKDEACADKCEGHHKCESLCNECGKCTDAECAEVVCSGKCEGHHKCEHICDECGNCTDKACEDVACINKCHGHHKCESICSDCGKCLDAECKDDACADKCEGHHKCESICDKCEKCTDAECKEDVCKEKCEGHEVMATTIYLVGDSTVSSFADDYLYPRYGWGTQLGGYLTDKATVVNLALSGRSSKSFTTEANYQTLIKNLKEGDYLLIAFGHNDEKSDDPTRFTDATLPYTDEASFGYHLYEYYVKIALEAGATPILVTPIVRAKSNNDYSGSEGHVTATGDYRQAIIDLGEAVSVDVIDMTAITRARYEELGYDEALKYHAVLQGKKDGEAVIENWGSVDKTHLNIYGAKYVAYRVASELQKLDGIKNYVAAGITEPTEADRVPNASYVVPDYVAPNLENYKAPTHFSTETKGWYGTAFGDTGGNPQSASNGYYATETSAGVFKVGNDKGKGKFSSSSDGFAFLFTQVEANKNFKISVTGKVLKTATTKQAGFGLMLRDDCVIDQNAAGTIATNYLTAGIYADSSTVMYANFYRENGTFHKGNTMNGMYAVGDVVTFTIERIGQTVHVTVEYNGVTYTESYYDFDLFARDGGYMYVGMFANRGTVVEFTNLKFEITGESQGA